MRSAISSSSRSGCDPPPLLPYPPPPCTLKMTLTCPFPTRSIMSPMMSHWTSQIMGSRSSTYTGPHLAQDFLPSLQSWWQGSSSRGAATSVATNSVNHAPGTLSSCTPSRSALVTSAPLPARSPASTRAPLLPNPVFPPMQQGLLPTSSPATLLLPLPAVSQDAQRPTRGLLPSP